MKPKWFVLFLALAAAADGGVVRAAANPDILDAYYRFDVPCTEFKEFWRDMSEREAALNLRLWEKPLAGSAHVYLKNTGTGPLDIEDVTVAGISLKRAIAFSDQDVKREADPASIFFSDLTDADRKKLIAAGDPIWWRVQPRSAGPGEVCEVAVRFRTNPPGDSVKLVLKVKGGSPIRVSVPLKPRPRFEAISFSRNLDRIYAYCTRGKQPPKRMLLNGRDITG